MSVEPIRAVFLSYASQDAEAARRICEALRTGGVEVWFDADGGLEHGDEWDAKIRKQIKECVLFIPVISANTQAREEGYFRLEWDLAAERARTIASGVPFILPVVIDDTREPDALVPDRFRTVQWTKLPGGVVTPEVKARYLKLWSHRTGVLKATELQPGQSRQGDRGESAAPEVPARAARRLSAVAWLGAAAVLVALFTFFALRPKSPAGAEARLARTEKPQPLSEAQQLVARARELTSKMDYTRADLEIAEGYARKATELDQGLAEAWGVRAYVNAGYLVRGFAVGDERNQRAKDAQTYANRAFVVNPDEPDALIALGKVLTGPVSEALLQRAVAKNPQNLRAALARGEDLRSKGRLQEAQVVFEEAARLHPASVGAHYDLAGNHLRMGNLAKSWDEILAALALQPFMRGLVVKAYLAGVWKGDLPLMRATLEQIAPADRTEDRAVYMTMWCGLLERRPERVLEAAAQTSRDYLIDASGFYTGPKASLLATAHLIGGRENLARQQWQSAETLLRRRLAQDAQNLEDTLMLATTLVWLQQEDEARRLAAPVELAWQEQLSRRQGELLAVHYAARRDGEKVAQYLRAVAHKQTAIQVTKIALRLDPCWDPVRGQPAFEALLAEEDVANKREGSGRSEKPDAAAEKSVAVLPFVNQSADKENEYFSDGIAEELLTTLQKIPGLRVAAWTSARSFKGKNATAQEVGAQLGMAHVVEGSVQKSGTRVKITARLSRAATNEAIWSKSFGPLELTDVFATQTELATAIVSELRGRLTGDSASNATSEIRAQVQSAAKGGTRDAEAHQLYLQGRFFVNQHTVESAIRAAGLLRRAVELDPKFALAWAALSEAGRIRSGFGDTKLDFDEGLKVAREAADQALALAPNLVPALLARENLLRTYEFDWKRAAESLRQAKALAPSDPAVLTQSSELAFAMGQVERAVELGKEAAVLDPVNTRLRMNLGYALTELGRYDEAKAEFQRIIEVSPKAPWGYSGIGLMLTAQGKAAEAVEAAAKVATKWERLYVLAIAEWALGNKVASDAALNEMISSVAEIAAVQIAWAYGYRRETDRAFEWLERAYRQHDGGLAWTKANFALESLHSDPRWTAFWTKFGLTEEQLR
jgi:TolB-like protein/Flp pilus assembly protein TadD